MEGIAPASSMGGSTITAQHPHAPAAPHAELTGVGPRSEDQMNMEATSVAPSLSQPADSPAPGPSRSPILEAVERGASGKVDFSSGNEVASTSQVPASQPIVSPSEPINAFDIPSTPTAASTSTTTPAIGSKDRGMSTLHPTLAAAPAVAEGSSSSQNSDSTKPPFHPPFPVRYPQDSTTRNPHYHSLAPKPPFGNIAPNTIFRPEYFPADLDDRLDQASIWMGIDKDSSAPRYFVPATCQSCSHPSSNAHCDRGYPTCGRCRQRGLSCVTGNTWRYLRLAKAKRAKEEGADSDDVYGLTSNPDHSHDRRHNFEGRNTKRTADDHYDTQDPYDKISRTGKKAKPFEPLTAPYPFPPYPSSSNDTPVAPKPGPNTHAVSKRPVRNAPKVPTADPAMTADDRAYFARIEANDRKEGLKAMKGECPVWADTRKALCSAAEYLRNPSKTVGASVEVGKGGIARGVILEGQAPGSKTFWGRGERAGTIVCSIGKPRPQNRALETSMPALPPVSSVAERGTAPSPPIDILESFQPARDSPDTSVDVSKNVAERHAVSPAKVPVKEASEIEALCMAQRARTPVAVALASDWSDSPFRVPRRFIVLGWFWVADAWVEPFGPEPPSGQESGQVIWRFRFEWCTGQKTPWWSSQIEPDRAPLNTGVGANEDVDMSRAWTISAPGLSPSTTIRPIPDIAANEQNARTHTLCKACNVASRRVYLQQRQGLDLCLNETCPEFFVMSHMEAGPSRLGLVSVEPDTYIMSGGITPDQLGLHVRPTEPSITDMSCLSRETAGRELWKAWVCGSCGKANERGDWAQWGCGACGRTIKSQKTVYDPLFLRNPSRPICTGPRQDDGSSIWAFPTTMSWSLFKDDIKVVEHVVNGEEGLGNGVQVFHALSTEGKGSHIPAGLVLRGLQKDMALVRPVQPHTTNRPAERYLSPFYTFACGHDAPVISHFPVGPAAPWQKCPATCLDAADLINERAGRMWPGLKERFNSIIIVALPPGLPTSQHPHIYIQPNEYVSLLFLGSDGEIRVRHVGRKGGEMKVQHGDVVGIRGAGKYDGAIEVILKPEGFGFVCVARQVYQSEEEKIPADGGVLRDTDFPALQQPKSYPRALPRGSQQPAVSPSSTINGAWGATSHKGDHASAAPSPRTNIGQSATMLTRTAASPPHTDVISAMHIKYPNDMVNSAAAESSSAAKAKAKKTQPLLEKASLSGWYIGPRPLDPGEPLRTLPTVESRREIVVPPIKTARKGTAGKDDIKEEDEMIQVEEQEKRWKGVVEIKQEDFDKITDLSPGPVDTPAKKKAVSAPAQKGVKGKGKGKGKGKAVSTVDLSEGLASALSSPAPSAKGLARGKNRAAKQDEEGVVSVKLEQENDVAASTPKSKAKPKPRAKPRASGVKGKGRPSTVGSTPMDSSPVVDAEQPTEDTEMADDDSGVGSVIQVAAP